MNILYVYAHPNPSSFNGMLKQHALDLFTKLKTNVKFSNLYEDHFKAIARISLSDTYRSYFILHQYYHVYPKT